MPTGYTSDICEGKDVEFSDFVMKCARAFGALIELREEPLSSPVPEEFKPSSYHIEHLEEAEAEVSRIKAWGNDEADSQAQLAYESAQRRYDEARTDKAAKRFRYEAMLAQVKAWTPPTSEHRGLKDFMVEQLEKSINSDCNMAYPEVPKRISGVAYKEQQLHSARLDVSYYIKHDEDEVKRAKERTDWIKALRQSLTESSDVTVEV